MTASTPAEWASAGSLGLAAVALVGLGLAFADADLAYFDPRPALVRAFDRLLVEVVRARPAVRRALTDAAFTAAALLALLTTPETTR